uniref:Polycystic kidney disease 1b n=1 Tax=Sparus aurata TaxID=8175 RepID=A0A671Y792_SPAAU
PTDAAISRDVVQSCRSVGISAAGGSAQSSLLSGPCPDPPTLLQPQPPPSTSRCSKILVLPDRAIMVYPDDVVAIQHTRASGTFIHCLNSEASLNSLWRQSYMSIRGMDWGGWWEGGLTSLPEGVQWVDGVVCDLRLLYVDKLPRGTEHVDDFGFTNTDPNILALTTGPTPSLRSKFELSVIHPVPDGKNQIHIQINVPTLIVVKVLSGQKARSSWSAPVLQTGVPFLSSCPEELAQSWPGCKRESHNEWFSSVTLVLPSEGVKTLNIAVMDAVSSQSVRLSVCGYEAVAGLSVEPQGCHRMLVETPQVRINLYIYNIYICLFYHVVLVISSIPADYKLKVRYFVCKIPACLFYADDYTLQVQVSNQYDKADVSMRINVRTPLNHLRISSSLRVPLVKQTILLEASTGPSTNAVIYTWDFGDGSDAVQGIHHKVSHSFASAGLYNVTVCVNNTLTVLTNWLVVEVVEKISGLTVSYNGPSELSSVTDFRATVATGTGLMWNFDFGDGSLRGNLTDGWISHIYKSSGNFTVHVSVINSVSQAHQLITVEVYRLAVSGVLPTECITSGRDIELTALVSGNISDLTFHWLFGDGSPLTVVRGQSTAKHTFLNQQIFHISLTVFSSVTSVSFNTSICVEAAITSVIVHPSQEVVAVGKEVCFRVVVFPEQMAGYQLKWFSSPSSLLTRTEKTQNCFIFKDEGIEDVSVIAINKVNNQTAKASITIQKPVSKLSLAHDSQSDTLTVGTFISFWVASCTGSNVTVLWDFGDGSPVEKNQNVSHVFSSAGQFTVTATVLNAVSRDSVSLKVNVLLPVSDLSLHTNQSYAVVGEETLILAISSSISSTNYYWTVDSMTSTKQGTYQFRFAFQKPGVYQVRVIAHNLVSRKEAAIVIEVFERIEGVRIKCQSLKNTKYVPTQEDLLFTASITKGSNVTYHWLATQSEINQQFTGNGELFHMLAETPGGFLVQLRASNKLGEATVTVSLEAIQLVTSAHITTQLSVVALGKVVNISVSVVAGSDLQYFWYVYSELSPLQTHDPFILHTFTSLGQCLVRVSVQNVLSQSNVTKEFNVQEEVQAVDVQIEGKTHPFYIATRADVPLHGLIRKGSNLHWNWTVTGAKNIIFHTNNQTFICTFPHAGLYQVSLNVSNDINWQTVSHSVTVQDAIKGLLLNMSKSSFCTEQQVTFIPTISSGTNVSFVITFRNKDWIHSHVIVDGWFTTSSLPAGMHVVTMKAWNQVSSAEVSSSFLVSEHIQGLRLVNCCTAALEALKGNQFKAEFQSGLPVNFTWKFYLVGFEPVTLMGQEVMFTPTESGLLSVSVLATNGICSKTVNDSATVQWPVKEVKLVGHSERIFVGHAVAFSAKVNGGSNLRYLWDFGESTDALATDLTTVSYTFYIPGKYSIMVKVFNNVSHVSTQLFTEVEKLQCSSPQASLVQRPSTISRSRPSFFEASVDSNCSAYKTTYLWEILIESDCTHDNLDYSLNKVILRDQVDVTTPILLLPKHSLDIGWYCLVFTVSFKDTPLLVRQNTTIAVVHSPLIAVIKGGSHRLWSSLSELLLDGSKSQDPDVEPGLEDTLQYKWTFVALNSTESHFVKQPIWRNSSTMTVLTTELHPGTVYIFTLTVHKEGRRPVSVNQTVSITHNLTRLSHTKAYFIVFIVDTLSSSRMYKCTICTDNGTCIIIMTPVFVFSQYKWSAEDQSGMALDLNEVTTSIGRHSPHLEVHSGILQPGQHYTFTLNVSQPDRGQWGSASVTILPNNPPHGGLCDLSPESDIHLLETVVTYNCSGNTVILVKVVNLIYIIIFGKTSGQSVRELMDRREIRKNVTEALASLPVSSLLDVDQISSALSLSTAVPSELVCENCQEKVLEAVGKMIHLMEEQMSPGVVSAVETGRNILNIIGAAYSSTLDSASTIALLALGHAEALMRSLMHSQVHGEAPLSLSTPYINAVGFHGDPSDLLCTHQSNPNQIITTPCQFHIPASLTAHLKSQKSEVVQVLFDMDAELGSNPLLTVANPPISTALVAMELSTPEGKPIPIKDLDPEQAIRVTLPNKYPVGQDDGGGDGGVGEAGNGTCLTVTLPTEGRLNLTVKAVDRLDENAGLYISFNFSLGPGTVNHLSCSVPILFFAYLELSAVFKLHYAYLGATPVSLGHVKIEVSSTVPGTNASQDSLPLSVSLTSSLVDGGPVHVTVCVFSSLCQYYSVKERRWSSEGLQPLEGSTLHAAHCLTQHLTMFGASLFVHPGAVVLLPPVCGPIRNMLVGIVCAVLVLIHLLVGLIAHKLDHLDSLRLSQVPLCGRPGLYHYRVLVKTGWRRGAGTTAHVGISLYGVSKSGSRHLQRDGAFQRGSLDQFHLETDDNLGEVWKIRIWHDNTGLDPSWYVQHVVVWDPQTDHMFFFLLEDWLSVENQKNGTVEKEVLASCPKELSQFRRVFAAQLMFGMVEHHLWLSLWERPSHSRFTRGQRVACSALVLHLYLALGALWYGAVGIQGHSGPVSAQLLVNVETVAVGMTVAALVFPLQCFLCFLFGKAHGVARALPGCLLPPWAVCVIYPLVAVLLGACLAVVGLYGSFLSRSVVLMWLVSALSALLTSALLLEPLKVCVQALILTAVWRPVDPEVEDQLAQDTTVVRAFGDHAGKIRPPCGYGLLQAKEEARKVRALRSLMRVGIKLSSILFFRGNQTLYLLTSSSSFLRLHRLPQCCPSGREVLSVCSYSAHSTCSKGRLNESRVHHSATIHSFTAFPSLLKANSFPLLCFQLMGNLRFVRRWVVLGRVLQRAWRELWALTVLLLLLLLLFDVPKAVSKGKYCKKSVLWSTFAASFRAEQAELHRPTIEPQDYEMVEFFIKRLKLWMGLTKTKEFRHRVKFEGMDIPPSRSSQESRLSTLSSTLPSPLSSSLSSSFSSPRPLSSAVSMRSEDLSEPGFDVQPYLVRLLPCVSELLSRFDQVNQITEDVHSLEMKLEEAQARRRNRLINNDAARSGESPLTTCFFSAIRSHETHQKGRVFTSL